MPTICIFLLLAIAGLSCAGNSGRIPERLAGTWQADYADSLGTHERYLTFRAGQNGALTVTMDEPGEDWYDVPVSCALADSTVSLDLWWGLERLHGSPDDTGDVLRGTREVPGAQEPFTYRKLAEGTMLPFRNPRTMADGGLRAAYRYAPPEDTGDGIPVGDIRAAGIDTTRIYGLMNRILDGSLPKIHALLIVKDGELVLEEYFYGYGRARMHRAHSVTKSFTSALIGIARDAGYLAGADEYAYSFFPEYGNSPWVRDKYPITVQHLLEMMSGLRWQPVTLDRKPDSMAMYESDDCLGYLFSRAMDMPPGTQFQYNDGNSILLGKIIEKTTRMPVTAFAAEHLFGPLGITGYTWDINHDGTVRTDGGLRLLPRDMAKFGMLYLDGGRWHGSQIVPADWVRESTSRHTPIGQQAYGDQWWLYKFTVNHRTIESYCAVGHGEQFIIVAPELDLVAVFTAGNYLQTERMPLEIMADTILPACLGAEPPPPVSEPGPDFIANITGEYAITVDERLTIRSEDGALVAIDPAGNRIALSPAGNLHYVSENPPREAVFVKNEAGDITHVEIYVDGILTEEFVKM